jgi:hypothetical protein
MMHTHDGDGLFSALSFDQVGRSCQLRIRDARDLDRVLKLDRAHWVSLSAPVESFVLDQEFLAHLDIDKNGRITCDEVCAAIEWLCGALADRRGVTAQVTTLAIETIDTSTDDGAAMRRTAESILLELGAAASPRITLDQVRQVLHAREARPVSELGVVLPSAAEGPLADLLSEIAKATGGIPHPAGQDGVTESCFADYVAEIRTWLSWRDEGVPAADGSPTRVMPLGSNTPAAYATYLALQKKIDQYFAQCEAVAFSSDAADLLRVDADDWKQADLTDPTAIQDVMREAPLAPPMPAPTLRPGAEINPHYAPAVEALFSQVVTPILGPQGTEELTPDGWASIQAALKPHAEWLARRCGARVAQVDEQLLKQALEPAIAEALHALVMNSRETGVMLDAVRQLEKLLLYQANMLLFLNNYVSFPYLYDPSRRARFEMGTLIMDGRELSFAVRVKDVAAHAASSQESQIHMLYVAVTPGEAEPYTVAVPVTAGGRGNLAVGKRGVFVDIAGSVHDARVTKCIENPISVSEALASPFQRIGKLLTGKIEKMTSAAEKQLDTTANTTFDQLAAKPQPESPTAAGPSKGAMVGGMLMGGGVALAALSSAAAYITSVFSDVGPWKVTFGLLAAVLAVVMPASMVSLFKLRKRDLSAVLEGCGWAINARMRLTFPQGRQFTRSPRLPGLPTGIQPRTLWLAAILVVLIVIRLAI